MLGSDDMEVSSKGHVEDQFEIFSDVGFVDDSTRFPSWTKDFFFWNVD